MARPPGKRTPSDKLRAGNVRSGPTKERRPRDHRAAASKPEILSNPIYPTPLVLGQADPQVIRPLLIPFPAQLSGPGRRFLRPIVNRLVLASGAHVLRGYDALMANGGKAKDVSPRVEAVAPRSIDFMRRIGRQHLNDSGLTVEAADRLAALLYPPSDGGIADSHLSTAGLIATALTRAHRIIDATDAALNEKDRVAAEALVRTAFYTEPSNMSRSDLARISACADINAAVLWPQYIADMPVFEVARFAARLLLDAYRPAEKRCAKLLRNLFPAARLALGAVVDSTAPSDVIEAFGLVRTLLEAGRPSSVLLGAIEGAYMAGLDLVIGDGEKREGQRPE